MRATVKVNISTNWKPQHHDEANEPEGYTPSVGQKKRNGLARAGIGAIEG